MLTNNRNNQSDIYGYDLSTSQEFAICTEIGVQGVPDVYGDLIIWGDRRNGLDDIYGYDLVTQTEFVICTDGENATYNPVFYEKTVVWENSNSSNQFDIYGLTISESAVVPVPGAVLLGSIGMAFAGWKLRRRRDL